MRGASGDHDTASRAPHASLYREATLSTMAAPRYADPLRADCGARVRAERAAREAAARLDVAVAARRVALSGRRRVSWAHPPRVASPARGRPSLHGARPIDTGRRRAGGRHARAAVAPLGSFAEPRRGHGAAA